MDDQMKRLQMENEMLKKENLFLKSQVEINNEFGNSQEDKQVKPIEFDKARNIQKFKEHCKKYCQLKSDFEDIKNKFSQVKETLRKWKVLFEENGVDWESEIDLKYFT